MSQLIFDVNKVPILAIDNQFVPKEGPKCVPIFLDFTAVDTYVCDFTQKQQQGFMSMVQTVFIDTSGTDQSLSIVFNGTNQKLVVKGRTQGYYNVAVPNPVRMTINCSGGPQGLQVFLFNVPIPGAVWPTL